MAENPTAPGVLRRLGTTGLEACALLALATGARMRPLRNADLLWQIPSGDAIARAGHRLSADVFSQTLRGAPLLDHEPASELLFRALHRAGGFATLWWASLAILACAVVLAHRGAARIAPAASARLLSIGAVLLAVGPRLDLRAEWLAFAAVAIAHAIRREGDSPLRRCAPLAVAAIAAPFHGLAIVVAAVPLAHAAEHALARRSRDALLDLAVAAAVPLVVFAVSPAAVFAVSAHLHATTFSEHLLEYYSPLRYARASGDPTILLALALSLLAAWGLFGCRGGTRRADPLLVLLLVLPGFVRARFAVLAPLAALPWVVAGIAVVLARPMSRLREIGRFALATLGCAVIVTFQTAELGLRPVVGFDFSDQPVEAVEFLQHRRPSARLFHPFNFGAYLLFVRFGSGPMIDARAASLYPEPYARAYYEALADEAKLAAYLAPFDTVLLHRRHRGTERARKWLYEGHGFHVLWEDSVAVVFGRR